MSVLLQEDTGIYFRTCAVKDTATEEICTALQTFDATTKECTDCDSLFENCAACSVDECVVCEEDYYLETYKDATNKSRQRCSLQFCGAGFAYYDYIGHTVCEAYSDTACASAKVTGTSSAEVFECILCNPGYTLAAGTCTAITTTVLEQTYYVFPMNFHYPTTDAEGQMSDFETSAGASTGAFATPFYSPY